MCSLLFLPPLVPMPTELPTIALRLTWHQGRSAATGGGEQLEGKPARLCGNVNVSHAPVATSRTFTREQGVRAAAKEWKQ